MLSAMVDEIDGAQPHSKGISFLLWLACFMGFAGIHRFYLGRPVSGFLYLITFGIFGFGQFIDLFLLPGMVNEENQRQAALRALAEKQALRGSSYPALPPAGGMPAPTPRPAMPEDIRVKLLNAAAKNNGMLSVTQGVMATGKTFEEVEEMLDSMVHSGYVDVTNDPDSGVVVYNFGQLAT